MMPLVLTLLAFPSADGSPLAKQAMAVLRAHCGDCHGEGAGAKAGLSVLDREQLITLRRVVVPGRPQASELVLLLDTGAMPPGTRPKPSAAERDAVRRWVEAGAPAEASRPVGGGRGDDYVLSVLARDWAKVAPGQRPVTRYVSLNHLADADRPAPLKELRRILDAHAPAGAAALEPVDEPPGVFRLNLKTLGWDRRPLRIPREKGFEPSPLNLFDLILLEYPFGYLAFSSLHTARAIPLVRQMQAVRPVPYVRGDWLAAILANQRFAAELLTLAGYAVKPIAPPPQAVWPGQMKLERATLELGWRGDPGRLKRALDDVGLPELPLGRVVFRPAWEMRFPLLVRKLELGTPIVPLNGLTVPDTLGDGSMKVVLGTRKLRYHRGEDLQPVLNLQRDAAVRLLHLDPAGTMEVVLRGETPRRDATGTAALGSGFTLGKEAVIGDNQIILLAFPNDAGAMPPGDVHEPEGGKKVRGRYVLRVYQLNTDGTGFEGPDAGKIVKATAVYEFARARK